MAPRDLTAALLAVLGVYLLGAAITNAGVAAFFLNLDSSQEFLRKSHASQGLLTVVVGGVEVGFGLAVLLLHKRIAACLFPESPNSLARIELADLQAAAFAVLGVYFVIDSVPRIVQGVLQLSPRDTFFDLWPSYAPTFVRGLLGLALVLGARVTSGAWILARRAGRVR